MLKRINIRTLLLMLVISLAIAGTSCNRSTCPTFDENAGEDALKGSKKKTKSGALPKGMN